ncbi:MAG: MATE family efflux transporter [Bacteroidota bacterium]
MSKNETFGTESLGRLLRQQAIPASTGILVMSIYGIVDTIFVGHWVGALGIGAITVVMPITFLISSVGMAIGIGGSSIISRAFGEGNDGKATRTFGNQVILTLSLSVLFMLLGFQFQDEVLHLFGGKGEVLAPAKAYFQILLYGVPFLAWAMMSTNVIRAEGFPKISMIALIVPAITNMILDPIFIVVLDMGIEGAAWATTLAYAASATFTILFFLFGKSQMQLTRRCITPSISIIREIASIGSVTLARQGTISVLSIVLNNALFTYGGELALSVYGIIGRVLMFANFPVLGITQGFVPIVGFNYGAKLFQRVKDLITLSMKSASVISFCIFVCIMLLTPQIVSAFTTDEALIEQATPALRWVFGATPLLAISLLGSAYFQAIGKAVPALFLTLTKQGFFLIPLILILPNFFGLNGVWYAFPIADIGAAAITYWYLKKDTKNMSAASVPR